MSKPPEGFRHCTRVEIRFGDMDAMGHVNNAKYLTYMETARIRYVRELQLWDGTPSAVGAIMAKATVDFKLPLHLNDGAVDVYTRISRLGNKSLDMEHQIICYRDGQPQVAALGLITIVAYDYHRNQAVPLPDEWRQRVIKYEPALRDQPGGRMEQ